MDPTLPAQGKEERPSSIWRQIVEEKRTDRSNSLHLLRNPKKVTREASNKWFAGLFRGKSPKHSIPKTEQATNTVGALEAWRLRYKRVNEGLVTD